MKSLAELLVYVASGKRPQYVPAAFNQSARGKSWGNPEQQPTSNSVWRNMGLRSHYLVRHGAGYRFQMGVPGDLRGLLGRKVWRRYLAMTNEPEARLAALQLAAKCRREIDRLRKLPNLEGTQLTVQSRPLDAADIVSNDVAVFRADSPTVSPLPLSPTVGQYENFINIPSLVDLWKRVAQPRAAFSILRMKRCVDELVSLTGDVSANCVTRLHIMRYRDMLENKAYSRSTAKQYLESIHRLFGIALSEGVVESNPATGIKVRSGLDKFADRQRRRPFEVHELRGLVAALGGEPEPFRWLVKVLMCHGMRSGEAAQLRVEDVTTLSGVAVIRVHDRHGSLKNRNSQRDIPLHPRCTDFIAYARSVSGPWIFPQETMRSDRFQRLSSDFIRKRVKLADRTLTMHSLRHTWRTLAREISMPQAVSRAIMGHSMGGDVHDEYGGGPSLRLMAEWMAKIEVMPQTAIIESQ